MAQLSLTDALMRFLQIWQALPDFGLSYVVVRLSLKFYLKLLRVDSVPVNTSKTEIHCDKVIIKHLTSNILLLCVMNIINVSTA